LPQAFRQDGRFLQAKEILTVKIDFLHEFEKYLQIPIDK